MLADSQLIRALSGSSTSGEWTAELMVIVSGRKRVVVEKRI
jgi:hypothetical protein